jgi:hypothetical protein
MGGANVGVPNEGHVSNLLNSHDTQQRSHDFVSREKDAVGDLVPQLLTRHIRFCPAIRKG